MKNGIKSLLKLSIYITNTFNENVKTEFIKNISSFRYSNSCKDERKEKGTKKQCTGYSERKKVDCVNFYQNNSYVFHTV